jgi:hypothetical protein
MSACCDSQIGLVYALLTSLCLREFALPAAYTMIAIAGSLLGGLIRAKALSDAHEQFSLTPVLIGETGLLCPCCCCCCLCDLAMSRGRLPLPVNAMLWHVHCRLSHYGKLRHAQLALKLS